MSRKDTIIISVLVNAGLLLVLFISAVAFREDSSSKENALAAPAYKGGIVQEAQQYFSEPYNNATASASDAKVEKIESVTSPVEASSTKLAVDTVSSVASTTSVDPQTQEVVHVLPPVVETATEEKVAETPEVAAVEKENVKEIKVKRGDSLEKIAKVHKTSIAEIKRLNQLQTHFLRIGQRLLVPDHKVSSTVAAAHKESVVKTAAATGYYIVKCGDNPWTIAMKHHIKVEDLLRLNHMTKERAKHLKPGDKIRVR